MSEALEQVQDETASEIVNAFRALRRDGVPPKRALELARIKARQDAEDKSKSASEILSAFSNMQIATGASIAVGRVRNFVRDAWALFTANVDVATDDSIGATADATFRELMLLYSRNPRDRIHAEVKGDVGSLRIDLLDHESDFVIKDWLWNLLKAFREETGSPDMPADGLARLHDALEVGFSLSSMWNAHCWNLHLLFNDVRGARPETMSGILGLLSTNPDGPDEEMRRPTGERTQTWEPTESRTVTRQAESYDGTVEVAVYIDDWAAA